MAMICSIGFHRSFLDLVIALQLGGLLVVIQLLSAEHPEREYVYYYPYNPFSLISVSIEYHKYAARLGLSFSSTVTTQGVCLQHF